MKHIMIDLETLDTKPSAVVVSLGAVAFDPFSGELGEQLSVSFAGTGLDTQMKLGRTVSGSTLIWWAQQNDAVRAQLSGGDTHTDILDGLSQFGAFITRNGNNDACVWGNGAAFDNVILASLYNTFKREAPWSFSKDRCYRTMKNLYGRNIPLERLGEHHNALADALSQATHLARIFHHING